MKKPEIIEYTSYRDFLRDRYQFLKETTTYFSYRYFSKKAGFSSPNYLKVVIEGERNISEESIPKFAQAFALNKQEQEYFKYLVGFTQATNSHERSENALKLLQSKIYQNLDPLHRDKLDYYKHWFYTGVRELALCKNTSDDPKWIAKQFKPELTVKEAKDALKSLRRLGMLSEKEGSLMPTEQNVAFENGGVFSSVVSQYHKRMMDKAKESLDVSTKDEREVSSICVPVSEETFKAMRARIRDFRKELIALASQDTDPNQVYQLNLQLFPLTKKVDS